eukprot:scaffold87191_cov33-Tisochrysis_lutea.AAC.3
MLPHAANASAARRCDRASACRPLSRRTMARLSARSASSGSNSAARASASLAAPSRPRWWRTAPSSLQLLASSGLATTFEQTLAAWRYGSSDATAVCHALGGWTTTASGASTSSEAELPIGDASEREGILSRDATEKRSLSLV